MMNKFCVVLFIGFVCLVNVKAEQDDFIDYWDYDTQWYNDELENLGIISKESNEDNERNVVEISPIEVDYHLDEIPEIQEMGSINQDYGRVIEENDQKEVENDENADERVKGEINQYLEEQESDTDEFEEKRGIDVNDYLVEDNRSNGFDSDDDIKGFEELNRKMLKETKELLAKESDVLEPLNENEEMSFDEMKKVLHEDDDENKSPYEENGNQELFDETKQILDKINDDWEIEDGFYNENDNLEDIYDDFNDDLKSLSETWRKLSMSGENLESNESNNSNNNDNGDVNEVFDDNIDNNEEIDENVDNNEGKDENVDNNENFDVNVDNDEVKDYEENLGPFNEAKLLVNKDYNYDEMYKNENQVEIQPSIIDNVQDIPLNDMEDNVSEEEAQDYEMEEDQSVAQQEELREKGENLAQEDVEEQNSSQEGEEDENSSQEVREDDTSSQEVEGNLALNQEEYESKSQEGSYYSVKMNPGIKDEKDKFYAIEYPEEDQQVPIEDNAESEQEINTKILKAAAEAHKTVDEFLYGQNIVYLNDNLEETNYLETQDSKDMIDLFGNNVDLLPRTEEEIQVSLPIPTFENDELSNKMASFVIEHQREFDTSVDDFDKNVAPVFISLKVDEATEISSPNYPEAYPGNNIVDWIFDGEGTGIELNITEFDVDGIAGDYLLVKPGGVDNSGHEGLVFSYQLTSEKRYRFLDVDKMFVRFESKTGTEGKGFIFSVRMINSPPEVIEEPVTLPSVEIEEDKTVKVYLGVSPAEFLNVTDEFRNIVADMATMYINSNGIERGNLTTYDATKLTIVTHCNVGWPNHERCVSVRFGVNLDTEDGRLSSEDLEDMWIGYVNQDPFAARMRWLGLLEYAPPDRASTLMVWAVLGFGALLCGLMLAFTVWKCGSNTYVRMPELYDTESMTSEKKKFSELYPTPHQNLPPLYDQDFIRYELDDTRADLGGFPNKGYTRDEELYDIESEEELPHITNRSTNQ